MKIYVDDLRIAPTGYVAALSVNQCKDIIEKAEKNNDIIEIIDLDHDLGDYAYDGGDAIKILYWLIERETFYPIAIHTANPVGRENMQKTIERYWPK